MKRSIRTRRSSLDSTSSTGSGAAASPRKRLRSTDDEESAIKVYIVQEKLDAKSIQRLFNLIESTQTQGDAHQVRSSSSGVELELCSNPEEADIIVTNIKMKKRLERHVNWDIARQKAIVTPDWIYDSVEQNNPVECGHYAALSELHDETEKHCPEEQESSEERNAYPNSQNPHTTKPTDPRVVKNWTSRYACARASPLVCVNQALAIELGILGRSRELEGKSINALSYERSVGIVKSYPYLITEETYSRDVVKLPGLGSKTLSKIREFLEQGYIEESRTTRTSQRFQSLSAFATIYGIGPSNARNLYDLGLRTFEDVERYYDVTPDLTHASLDASLVTPNGRKITSTDSDGKNNGLPPDLSVQVALVLRREFEVPIPRDEVEEMRRVVMWELKEIQAGCVSMIVGGYRRGKPQSNDVDIVISHPNLQRGASIIKGLCKKLTRRLCARGMVTHCMHLSGFHAHDALRTEHWDSLEKALTVFILPPSESDAGSSDSDRDISYDQGTEHGKPEEHGCGNVKQKQKQKRLHRRLDLIFAAPEAYWTAIVGWSGSKMFERDLRLWAKTEKGMKFDSSGMTRRHDSKLFIPRSEEEVFSILGLDWVDPTMRNADV